MVTAPRPIPPAVRDTQARASDPAASAFVSANAGSGKTHVLVQRVIRLLLDGVPPEKILCITFTKAAAANMAERVFSTLGHWVTLDDAALDDAIVEAGHRASRRQLADARPRTVRLRAGDAGRAEGADHPRALHPAAAAISVRGQCAGALRRARRARPERDDGARQSQGAARGVPRSPTAPPAARSISPWRAPPTSPSRTWCARLVSAAITSWPGPTPPAAPTPRRRRCPRHSASIPAIPSKTSSARSSTDRTCRDRDGRKSPPFSIPAANPIRTRPTRLREALAFTGARRSTNISACSSPMNARRASRW